MSATDRDLIATSFETINVLDQSFLFVEEPKKDPRLEGEKEWEGEGVVI